MHWYPHGRLPLGRVCDGGDAGGGGTLEWLPHRFLAVGQQQYVIVGLRPVAPAGHPPVLLGDVLWSGDGGNAWQCLSGNASAATRAGSEPFIFSTSRAVGSVTVQLDALCVSGGRELDPGGGQLYSSPLDSVVCASLTAAVTRGPAAPPLEWREGAPLPSASIGHVHTSAPLLLPPPALPATLIAGGKRLDGSDDVWIAASVAPAGADAAAAPSLEAALEAHAAAPGPSRWWRLPASGGAERPPALKRSTLAWYPGPRVLVISGGLALLWGPGSETQFVPRPTDAVDLDSGGWPGESSLVDGCTVRVPPLTADVLLAAAGAPGNGSAPAVLPQAATVQLATVQLPEPPRLDVASTARTLGFMQYINDDVVFERPESDECILEPLPWCAIALAQVGAETFIRSMNSFIPPQPVSGVFFRLRGHLLYNGSAQDPQPQPARLGEAPGVLLGLQTTWALQQRSDRRDERAVGLEAARNGSWYRGNASGIGTPPLDFGHMLVANANTGLLFRGSLASCARNFSCPRGWFPGSCTSGPYSAQCHPCGGGAGVGVDSPLCSAAALPGDAGGAGGRRCVLRIPSPLAEMAIAAACAIVAVLLRGLWVWFGGLRGRDALLRERPASGAARPPVEMVVWVGAQSLGQLVMLSCVLAAAHASGCAGGGWAGGEAAAYGAILALLLLGPAVTACAIAAASCILPSLHVGGRLRDVLAAQGACMGGFCAAIATLRPWVLVCLLLPPVHSAGKRRAAQHPRALGVALAAAAAAHAALVELPTCIALLVAFAASRPWGIADVAERGSLPLLLPALLELLLVVEGGWHLARRLARPARGGPSGAVEEVFNLSSVVRAKPGAPDVGSDTAATATATASASASRGDDPASADANRDGTGVTINHPAAPPRLSSSAASAPPPAVQRLPINFSDLWQLAATPEGCALAGHGLFFRGQPSLLPLAAAAVQLSPLPEPWLALLRRLDELATQTDPARYWPLAAAAADELLLSLNARG